MFDSSVIMMSDNNNWIMSTRATTPQESSSHRVQAEIVQGLYAEAARISSPTTLMDGLAKLLRNLAAAKVGDPLDFKQELQDLYAESASISSPTLMDGLENLLRNLATVTA